MSYRSQIYNCLKVSVEGTIAILQFNQPETLNKATPQLVSEYYDILHQVYRDRNIKVVIITGDEKAYCAGGSCKVKEDRQSVSDMYEIRGGSSKTRIAMISGYCLGAGFQNAMSCDLRIAGDNARFALPANKNDWPKEARIRGPYQPKDKGMYSLLSEEVFGAEEAYNNGFVNMVVPLKRLKETTLGIARVVANKQNHGFLGEAVI